MKPDLSKAPKYTRSLSGRGLKGGSQKEPPVDRTGGKFGQGIIRGVSLNTRGEALGHDLWLDAEFVDSVVSAAGKKKAGLKARFTHPGLSSDGMGSQLGHLLNVRRDGDQAVGDLHFTEASHNTPDGDLAEFVMKLAEETPEDFGLSIVFMRDRDAEEKFSGDHQEEFDYTPPNGGKTEKRKRFKSPDPDNVKGLRHARLSELVAGDVVDEPAANPNGLFTRKTQGVAVEADELAAFALGLSNAAPKLSALSVHPDRVKRFAERFLDSRGLKIVPKDTPMATDATPATPANKDAGSFSAGDLKKYTEKFGAELGVKYLSEGLDWTKALEQFSVHQAEELKAAQGKAKEAADQLSSLKVGEKEPLKEGNGGDGKPEKKGLASVIRIK